MLMVILGLVDGAVGRATEFRFGFAHRARRKVVNNVYQAYSSRPSDAAKAIGMVLVLNDKKKYKNAITSTTI